MKDVPIIEQAMKDYFDVLSMQVFTDHLLDYTVLHQHINTLRHLDILRTSSIAIFDLYKKEHVYLSNTFESVLGYDIEKAHSTGNHYFDSKIHPEDFIHLIQAGAYFIRLALSLSPQKRKHYKAIMDYRIKNGKNEYVRVIEQFQGLELDQEGNIWLALCIMDISPDQDLDTPLRNRLINIETGEIFHFPIITPSLSAEKLPLTDREKEVLQLIAQGLISKQIADKLYISVHTVNTHRQRIIEKLNVSNSSEAIQYASRLGLMG